MSLIKMVFFSPPVCRDFLDADMSRTKVLIASLSTLLAHEDPELEKFITR